MQDFELAGAGRPTPACKPAMMDVFQTGIDYPRGLVIYCSLERRFLSCLCTLSTSCTFFLPRQRANLLLFAHPIFSIRQYGCGEFADGRPRQTQFGPQPRFASN